MNWFERHLNWTLLLDLLGSPILVYGLILLSALILSFGGYLAGGLLIIILAFVAAGTSWWVIIWVIRQKRRSLGHLFWALIPFGFIAWFLLQNRSEMRLK